MQSATKIISAAVDFDDTSSPHLKASVQTGYLHKCLFASTFRFIRGTNSGRSVIVTLALVRKIYEIKKSRTVPDGMGI